MILDWHVILSVSIIAFSCVWNSERRFLSPWCCCFCFWQTWLTAITKQHTMKGGQYHLQIWVMKLDFHQLWMDWNCRSSKHFWHFSLLFVHIRCGRIGRESNPDLLLFVPHGCMVFHQIFWLLFIVYDTTFQLRELNVLETPYLSWCFTILILGTPEGCEPIWRSKLWSLHFKEVVLLIRKILSLVLCYFKKLSVFYVTQIPNSMMIRKITVLTRLISAVLLHGFKGLFFRSQM